MRVSKTASLSAASSFDRLRMRTMDRASARMTPEANL